MTPSEEYYLKVRNKLDDIGYLQPLSFESVLLVDKLLEDLLLTKKNLQHYKNVAQQSMEACSELQAGVGPYKEDNAKLLRENNELRQKLLKAREAIEETKIELRREIRNLEKERTLQDYLCTQHASKISQLQTELAQKTAKLMEFKGSKNKYLVTGGPQKKSEASKLNKDQMLEKAQDKINHLTQQITKLKSEQQELDEVIESLKNKVNIRDSEIERLSALLADGRPLMAQARNYCPCCSPQLLDCRLLAKNKQLSEQLEESKQKQHEAMIRAMELAEKNQVLQDQRQPSARSDSSKNSKLCCCAENSNKIFSLQEKLEERILQVQSLEQELSELKKSNAEAMSEKLSTDKLLENILEDKKRMHDRINELTIIERDLMLEIERLKMTNAMQKSQLAELEARFSEIQKSQKPEDSQKLPERKQTIGSGMDYSSNYKPRTGPPRLSEPRKPDVPAKKVMIKPKPPPIVKNVCKPTVKNFSNPAVKKPTTKQDSQRGTDSSTLSSSGPTSVSLPSNQTVLGAQCSTCVSWQQQLAKEKQALEKQLEEMARKQAEHCAQFHPPPCPLSAGEKPSQKQSDPQWLLLERVQAERDYYHKEFSRLRDQLCNIPDHSAEGSSGPASPHQKLEKLLTERDYYHREMCRLLDTADKSRAALASLEQQLTEKQDELNVLQGKLADLQYKLAVPEINSDMLKKISDKEEDIKLLSEKIRHLENQLSTGISQTNEDMKRRLNLKEEEILNLRDRLKIAENTSVSQDQQQHVSELLRKLNLKEEEILTLREKLRNVERTQQVPIDFTQTNGELWRRLNLKEDELLRMQDKIRSIEQNCSDFTLLKRKYNQKEEEILCLKEQIRELESNRCNNSSFNQAAVTRLELNLESAKSDCVRLREENNALRNDMQRLKESQRDSEIQLQQAKEDFDRCVSQFEVERHGLNSQIKQISEELRHCQERARELQAETSDQRSRCNHLKMVNEQNERELATTQDLLRQTEAQLASALDRVHEITDEVQALEWQLKETRQERSSLKANMARLDQEKDALLLKMDEKTEQVVRVEAELESRDCRIASLEGFIADLQKKLDVALDTAARSEQTSRQMTKEAERLCKELKKVDHIREMAIKENRRLQDDLAAMTNDHQQLSRCLEASKREVEDLKLQLQGYVAEVRRITDILEQKEAERMSMLEQYRSLTAESAHLESNNHSLESEARSTKTRLREAQIRIQDLEATLGEKKALVHGYEKQIKDLTHQVAKMERKLESKSRAESVNKDLSRELEGQKHCLENRVDHLACINKQLEGEVDGLRGELCHLKEQLSKERKNSATLEDVLATTRQETLLRARDNSELKGQVQCLQGKLRELHNKLEHGSEALRQCQTECEDYQTQVEQLNLELTKERFKRAHLEENRSYNLHAQSLVRVSEFLFLPCLLHHPSPPPPRSSALNSLKESEYW